MDFFDHLFDNAGFMPHGHCYLWRSDVLTLQVGSNILIALAYYSIPLALTYFVAKRDDLQFKWIFALFATFILACGTTHVMDIVTIYNPLYVIDGYIRLGTGVVSVATAIALVRMMPDVLALPSRNALEEKNAMLNDEVNKRRKAEEELYQLNAQLEQRVEERTRELEQLNRQLQQALEEKERVGMQAQVEKEKFQFLAYSIPQIVWTNNSEGDIDYFNKRWTDLTGQNAQQTLGTDSWEAMVHPEDLEGIKQAWKSSMEKQHGRRAGV